MMLLVKILFIIFSIKLVFCKDDDIVYPGYWSTIEKLSEKPPDELWQYMYALVERACDKEDRRRKSWDLWETLLKEIRNDFTPEKIDYEGIKPGVQNKMSRTKIQQHDSNILEDDLADHIIINYEMKGEYPPVDWAS